MWWTDTLSNFILNKKIKPEDLDMLIQGFGIEMT